jgi:DNA-binding MarR family transcriptional regulator
MTALLDSLERQGILMRLPHPQDRRRKIIGMTPKGIDKIQLLKREIRTTEVAAMTDVGLDEIRRLTGLLQKHTDAWDRASKAYNGPITPF